VQRSSRKERLRHYGSPTPEETVIRGHKLYWHKDDVDRASIEDDDFKGRSHLPDDDTQHTVIKPVRSGVRFQFKIHFENASAEELGALLWLLDIAADKDYRLKLGMAKPLGLGAVSVDSALHLTERKARYTRLFDGDAWATGDEDDPQTVWDEAVEAFETWLLKHRDLNPSHKSSVAELTRIQMLLALLSWPGPDREETDYLQIEPENEYSARKVLPTPLRVLDYAPPQSSASTDTTLSHEPSGGRQTGHVKWFNDAKGYGFIAVDNSNQEIFVHYSDIQGTGHRSLSEGQSVRFTIAQGDRGPKAKNVEKL
jgi:cold shock CspA family protein